MGAFGVVTDLLVFVVVLVVALWCKSVINFVLRVEKIDNRLNCEV